MVRLVAFDLDQTLLGSDLAVSPGVKQAVAQAHRLGVFVTIATGREARLASRFAGELEIAVPIICAQGGCIYDHRKGRALREIRLAGDLIPRMVSAAHAHGWNIHFEASDRLYFPKESNHPPGFFELLRYSHWVRVGDLLVDMPEPPNKLIVTLNRPDERERVREEMKATLGERVTVVASHPYLIEALPAGVDKGHGLAWLADHLHVTREEVMAVGDSEADIPMLEWAGVGVAMGNGTSAVKSVADWVAPALDEDGAAVALEKFVFADAPGS